MTDSFALFGKNADIWVWKTLQGSSSHLLREPLPGLPQGRWCLPRDLATPRYGVWTGEAVFVF